MRWYVVGTAGWLLSMNAMAEEPFDSQAFYARHPNQVFNAPARHALTMGFIEGDEVPYMTYDGSLNGKPFYLELHGDQLRIHSGKRVWARDLKRATRPPRQEAMRLDARGTNLYMMNGAGQRPSVACLESLPAEVQRTQPHRTVFVIIDPLGARRLYQLPSLYASCKGLTWTPSRGWQAPWWQPLPDTNPPRFLIQYHRLTPGGFASTDHADTLLGDSQKIDQFTHASVTD